MLSRISYRTKCCVALHHGWVLELACLPNMLGWLSVVGPTGFCCFFLVHQIVQTIRFPRLKKTQHVIQWGLCSFPCCFWRLHYNARHSWVANVPQRTRRKFWKFARNFVTEHLTRGWHSVFYTHSHTYFESESVAFFRHSELKSLHSTDYRTFTGPKKGKCWEFLETAVPGWRHWDGSSTLEMVCTLGRGGRVSFAHLYLISALTQTRKQRKIGLMLAVIDTYSSLAVTLFLFHVPQTNHL